MQFRILTEGNITSGFQAGWYPFNQALGRTGESFASELREVRNDWAHNSPFSDDDAYRALDTGERLLRLVGAAQAADEVRGIRQNLRRVTADKDDKRVLKAAVSNPEAVGLQPWREVLQPHDDVATGNFHASEFAADLYKVATGGEADSGYADPLEFFNRTYLTEGLRDLIGRAVRRLSGDDNASPVINLQTNFGGGKTHSMLALWHVAAGHPARRLPAGDPGAADRQRLHRPEGQPGRDRRQPLQPLGRHQGRRHPGQHDLGRAGLAARRPRRRSRSSPRPTRTAPTPAMPCTSCWPRTRRRSS